MAATLVMSLAAGCSSVEPGVSQGVFTSSEGQFSVAVPPIQGMHAREGVIAGNPYVDFAQGEGEWMSVGGYSVYWITPPSPYASDEAFYADVARLVLPLSRDYADGYFTPVQDSRIQSGGHPAWQVVTRGGRDSINAYWVATAVDFGDRVGVVMLTVAMKSADYDGPASPQAALTWGDYPAFLASLKRGAE
jgi:hypothetical protein